MVRRPSLQGGRGSPSPAPLWRVLLPDSAACIHLSPRATLVGAATFAGPVLFFDNVSGALVGRAAGHPGGALVIAFCPSSALVATGGQDGQVHLFEPGEPAPSIRVTAGSSPVSHLVWSPDGDVLASACGRAVRFWSRAGELIGEIGEHASTVVSLVWSDAQAGWLSGCYGGVTVAPRATLQCERQLFARTSILAAAASPCGRYIAAGAQDPVVRLWDLHGGDEAIHLEGYKGKVATLAWGREGNVLATASGASVVLWSFAGGDPYRAPHAELSGHTRRVMALRFLQDGRALLTAAADGHLRLFDLTTSTNATAELAMGGPLHLLDVSTTGDLAMAAGTDGTLHGVCLSRQSARSARRPRRQALTLS